MQGQGKHTIVLMQPKHKGTRTYMDYDSVALAMDGICLSFEKKLKDMNPTLKNITYDLQDLYNYLDTYTDLCALVLEPQTNSYSPYAKDWIKKRLYEHLKRQAS